MPPSQHARRRTAHDPHRLDRQLARAAVGWSIWADIDVEDVADRLLTLAAGNRTALERALRRLEHGNAVPERDTASGRAAAALRIALEHGSWDW